MPSPRIALAVILAALSAGAARDGDAPAPPTIEPGRPLESSFAAGDLTGQVFTATFTPAADGTWVVVVSSDQFNPTLEVRARQQDGSLELLGRVKAEHVLNPRLTFEVAAGQVIEVSVAGTEALACGTAFSITATEGRGAPRSGAEIVELTRKYWVDLLQGSRARGDAACEVRALLGQHAAVRRDGHLSEALALVDEAITTAEGRLGPSSPFLGWALNAKGRLLREQGQSSDALPLLERGEAIIEAHYGPNHPATGDALQSIAGLYGVLDRLQEREALLERVLAIRQRTLPPGSMDIGWALSDLAISCVDAGDLARARALLAQAVSIAESQKPQDPEDVASALGNLAWVQRRLGDDLSARDTFQRVLAIYRATSPPARKSVARTAANLGRVMEDLGDPAAARALYDEALAIDVGIYGANHATPAGFELRIARLLAREGRFDEARDRAAKAVAVFETTLGPRHSRTGDALAEQAVVERLAGSPERALALIDRAIDIAEALIGPTHPDLAGPLRLRAAIDIDLGRTNAAVAAALRAEEIGRDQLRLAARALAEAPALRYAATRPRGLDLALRLAATAHAPSPDLDRMVWDSLVRSRALVLDEMARRRVPLAADDAQTARLRDDVVQAGGRLARLLVRAADGDAPGDILAQVESARRTRDQKEEALAARSAAYQAGRREEAAGLAEIAARLGSDEALVSYARIDLAAGGRHVPGTPFQDAAPDEVYVAFVERGPGGAPRFVRVGSAATIDASIARWRASLVAAPKGLGGGRAALESAIRSAGADLRAAIWDPIAPALGLDGDSAAISTVFVVPDGALAFVNLAALPAGKDRYLVETSPAIQLLSAERDLIAAGAASSGAGRALVVGGPDYDAGGGAARARLFAPLPEASAEAGEVAASLRHAQVADVNLLTGRGATETAFKRLAPGRRYLHLATHAFWTAGGLATAAASTSGPRTGPEPLADALVHGVDNPLDVSGVALAGANRRARIGSDAPGANDPVDDGILTADEVATLDLNAAGWVVLSGCDTGLGASAPGEGLLGLQRAFRIAGARGLVVSLWQVPDLATREWMKLVYAEARAGASPAAALRRAARRWLDAQRRDGAPTSPAVWGAFIATGPAR